MLQTPNLIAPCKRIVEGGFTVPNFGEFRVGTVFESNLAYTLRFMIDQSVPGANWIELPAGTYTLRDKKTSHCQLEVDVLCVFSMPLGLVWVDVDARFAAPFIVLTRLYHMRQRAIGAMLHPFVF